MMKITAIKVITNMDGCDPCFYMSCCADSLLCIPILIRLSAFQADRGAGGRSARSRFHCSTSYNKVLSSYGQRQ